MLHRILAGLVLAMAAAVLVPAASAQDKTHDGMVVSVADGKLVMHDNQGQNEHTHTVAATTKVTLGGKDAKLTELKKGDKLKVTIDAAGKVMSIAATRG